MKTNTKITGIIVLVMAIIVAVIIAIWMPSRSKISNLDFNIFDANHNYHFETGERLDFVISDSISYAHRKVLWHFGNGDVIEDIKNVNYTYKKPGRYKITLSIDDQFNISKDIEVLKLPTYAAYDSIVKIGGSDVGFVNEELVFSSFSPGVSQWKWEFGESGMIDSEESQAIYVYKTPGIYTVTLKTNMNKYPAKFRVEIFPQFNVMMDEPTDSLGMAQNDIKNRFQAIANATISEKKVYYKNFNHIKNKYTCNNGEKVTVVVNGKYNDLYSYCQGLHFLEGRGVKTVTIDEVKIDTFHCIKRIEVIQSTIQK